MTKLIIFNSKKHNAKKLKLFPCITGNMLNYAMNCHIPNGETANLVREVARAGKIEKENKGEISSNQI